MESGSMIAGGILAVILGGILSMNALSLRSQTQSNLTFQADNMRRSIVSALNGQGSWKSTVMDPANSRANGPMLDCLPTFAPGPTQPGYVCTTDGVTNLPAGIPLANRVIRKINDAGGLTVYDGTQPNFGMSLQGTPCANFVTPPADGNDQCPLRFNVIWSARCTATTCVNPQVQLQVVVVYNPSPDTPRLAFNENNYGTPPFIQGSGAGGSACWAQIGGNLIDVCPGNVGIGTNAPVGKLHVMDNIFIDSRGSLPSGPQMVLMGTTDDWVLANSYPNGQRFDIGHQPHTTGITTPYLSMLPANGNVGIGTTSPKSALQISPTHPNPYLQITTESMSAPSGCSNADHVGRVIIWSASMSDHRICFCPQNRGQGFGWKCAVGI